MKKIALADKSRKNRVFFDNLIREIVICLNCGDTVINRELELPVYACHKYARTANGDDKYFQITRDSGMFFKPLGEVLSEKYLDSIDQMLREAPSELKLCGKRALITSYISEVTDLTDCHFSALNQMTSIQ